MHAERNARSSDKKTSLQDRLMFLGIGSSAHARNEIISDRRNLIEALCHAKFVDVLYFYFISIGFICLFDFFSYHAAQK
jgi:hypothetical protein